MFTRDRPPLMTFRRNDFLDVLACVCMRVRTVRGPFRWTYVIALRHATCVSEGQFSRKRHLTPSAWWDRKDKIDIHSAKRFERPAGQNRDHDSDIIINCARINGRVAKKCLLGEGRKYCWPLQCHRTPGQNFLRPFLGPSQKKILMAFLKIFFCLFQNLTRIRFYLFFI